MPTLHIEHRITSYDEWRAAFDGFADARHEAGVLVERVARLVDDPCYVVVGLDFDSAERAAAFLVFLETGVWTGPVSAPALVGRPRTAIFELSSSPAA
jgi:hypothetical protein